MGVEGCNDLLKFLEISANKKLMNDIDASLYDSQSLVLKIADSRTHRPKYTRGDQKVLQLGYKKLAYYMIYITHFLTYSHAISMHIFNLCSQLLMP